MLKNNPQFFINFLVFQHTACWLQMLCLLKHFRNSVFRRAQLFKNTVNKTHFSPLSKNTFFKTKVSFLVLGNFRWNHNFYSFSWFSLFLVPTFLAKTDSAHENARFWSLPDTNRVRQLLLKIIFFHFSHFGVTTVKTLCFIVFSFPFYCFLFSVSLAATLKRTKAKNAFFSSKTSCLTKKGESIWKNLDQY